VEVGAVRRVKEYRWREGKRMRCVEGRGVIREKSWSEEVVEPYLVTPSHAELFRVVVFSRSETSQVMPCQAVLHPDALF
jgi:hypothetical protein